MQIKTNSTEERTLKILMEKYPITVNELQKELKISFMVLERILKKFQVLGIVILEKLPDKTYVRLLREDFDFIGLRQTQKKAFRKKKGKKEVKKYDGFMFQ